MAGLPASPEHHAAGSDVETVVSGTSDEGSELAEHVVAAATPVTAASPGPARGAPAAEPPVVFDPVGAPEHLSVDLDRVRDTLRALFLELATSSAGAGAPPDVRAPHELRAPPDVRADLALRHLEAGAHAADPGLPWEIVREAVAIAEGVAGGGV